MVCGGVGGREDGRSGCGGGGKHAMGVAWGRRYSCSFFFHALFCACCVCKAGALTWQATPPPVRLQAVAAGEMHSCGTLCARVCARAWYVCLQVCMGVCAIFG